MELVGGIGTFSVIGGDGARLEVNLDSATKFYKDLTLKKEDIVTNRFGIYSFLDLGRDGKAKLTKLKRGKHVLQGRTNCKTWTPKGSSNLAPETVTSMAVEYNGEQCADAFYGEQFEKLLAIGPNKMSSPEAQEVLSMIIEGVYDGISDSTYDMVHYAQHPLIASANTNGTWDGEYNTSQEWADYYDQQFATDESGRSLKGLLTLVDEEKAAGTTHFNKTFTAGEFSDTTGAYTGSDVTVEFRDCINSARPLFKQSVRRRSGSPDAMFLVTNSIYTAYYDYLVATYTGIPAGYDLRINGEVIPGVLFYQGLPVIAMDEWDSFGDELGLHHHRIVLTARGNFGVASDLAPIGQRTGLGLIMETAPGIRNKGRIDMMSTARIGTFLADTDFMVNKSLQEAKA